MSKGSNLSVADLPNFILDPTGGMGAQFNALGLRDYHAAASHGWRLPYGRNSDRSGFRLVLREERGTCSTKHALLAEVAREHRLSVDLLLGIYEMDENKTRGVGEALRRYGLARVPEAHCYLAYRGTRVDLTRAGQTVKPAEFFLCEERIEPCQIGVYKLKRHRRFVRKWATEQGLDFDRVWWAREECIGALAGIVPKEGTS